MKLAKRVALLTALSIALSQAPMTKGIVNQLITVETQAATNGVVKVVLPCMCGYMDDVTTDGALEVTLCGDLIENDTITRIAYKVESTTSSVIRPEDFGDNAGITNEYTQYTSLKEHDDGEGHRMLISSDDAKLTFEKGKNYKVTAYQCTATHESTPYYMGITWNEEKQKHDVSTWNGGSVTYYLNAQGEEVKEEDIKESRANIILPHLI